MKLGSIGLADWPTMMPSIPTRINATPRIVATVFAMTVLFLLGKKRWMNERGGRRLRSSAAPASRQRTFERAGALYNRKGAAGARIFRRACAKRRGSFAGSFAFDIIAQ